jgi:hypothetical protein
LLQDASDIAFDRLSRHPVKNFYGLLRRIIHDVNTFNQTLKAMPNMLLMNEGIEILSQEGDPNVQRISTRMDMAGVKIRKIQMDQQDFHGSQLALKPRRRWQTCTCEHVVIARTLTGTTDWKVMSFLVISSN